MICQVSVLLCQRLQSAAKIRIRMECGNGQCFAGLKNRKAFGKRPNFSIPAGMIFRAVQQVEPQRGWIMQDKVIDPPAGKDAVMTDAVALDIQDAFLFEQTHFGAVQIAFPLQCLFIGTAHPGAGFLAVFDPARRDVYRAFAAMAFE